MEREFRKSPIYYGIAWVILFAGVIILGKLAMARLSDPAFLAFDDYVEYWSAARLNLSGGNPYDPDQLAPLQLTTGRTKDVPIMMWNPPWTLALVMPLSWLPYPLSRLFWLMLNMFILFLCATWCWRAYGGAPSRIWISWLVAFTFSSPLHLLKAGQITLFLLLGVVGFLYFAERDRWWLAGAAAGLITLKPHLLYLVALALVIWAFERRKWALIGGFALSVMGALGIAWTINPNLIQQYVHAVTTYPPEQWATPTLGAVLRFLLGVDTFWLQFVPSVLGTVWFLGYWQRRRFGWCWREQMPVLILVSLLTSAYGWTFDYPVALVAIIQAVVWLVSDSPWSWAKAGWLTTYVAINLVTLFVSMEQFWFWWMSSGLLGLYWMASRLFNRPATESCV